jgi:hypothetical protein
MKTVRRTLLAAAMLLAYGAANAYTFESALDQPNLQFPTQGGMLTGTGWATWRFEVTGTSFAVSAIGGRLLAEGDLFGAIIPVNSTTGLPDFRPSDIQANALAGKAFSPPIVSTDYLTPLNVVLQPGDYALVIGGGLYGPDPGFGLPNYIANPMPWGVHGDGRLSSAQTAIPGQGYGTGGWSDPIRIIDTNIGNAWFPQPVVGMNIDPYNIEVRMVVKGDYLPALAVPEPNAIVLMLAGLGALMLGFKLKK